MTHADDLPLDEYHRAGLEITNGRPDAYKALYSRGDDVTSPIRSALPLVAGARSPRPSTAPP